MHELPSSRLVVSLALLARRCLHRRLYKDDPMYCEGRGPDVMFAFGRLAASVIATAQYVCAGERATATGTG
eukprot:1732688-Prymnesium_polylepis.1